MVKNVHSIGTVVSSVFFIQCLNSIGKSRFRLMVHVDVVYGTLRALLYVLVSISAFCFNLTKSVFVASLCK